MTAERLREIIAAYGATPSAWPEAEREPALALIAKSGDEFTAALEDAASLDQLLSMDATEPPAGLFGAIMSTAPTQKRAVARHASSRWSFPNGIRWPAGAALASLGMGLVGGYAYAASDTSYDSAETAYASAFGLEQVTDWIATETLQDD